MSPSEIQVALNAAGYGPLTVDGQIGQHTLDAVKRFQRLNGLMPDGVIGPKTETKLMVHLLRVPQLVASDSEPGGNVFSAAGMRMLGLSEGIKTRAYLDTKKIVTIGIGATWGSKVFRDWWEENRKGYTFNINSTMSLDEITTVTRQMIDEEYGAAVNKALNGVKIPQHAYDAAVHFIYNVGPGGVKWRWFEPFKNGDYCGASEIVKTYLKPPEIKGRRLKEAALMCKGIYHA